MMQLLQKMTAPWLHNKQQHIEPNPNLLLNRYIMTIVLK